MLSKPSLIAIGTCAAVFGLALCYRAPSTGSSMPTTATATRASCTYGSSAAMANCLATKREYNKLVIAKLGEERWDALMAQCANQGYASVAWAQLQQGGWTEQEIAALQEQCNNSEYMQSKL